MLGNAKKTIRLRTILLIVNLSVLVLPLCSMFFFRIYENSLVRQTETELISQAAFVSSVYKAEIKKLIENNNDYGVIGSDIPELDKNEYYTPIKQQIDLSKNILLPPRPDGIPPNVKSDSKAIIAGNNITEIIKDAQKITLSGIKILDYKGIVVSGRFETDLSFAHVEEVKSALQGKYTSVIRKRISDEPPPAITSISREANIRVFIAFPIINDDKVWGVVYLSRTPENILHHLYAAKEQVIIAGISILMITVLIVLFSSYTISKPIHQLIANTRKISDGKGNVIDQIESPVTKEIAMLSKCFSEMSITLDERSNYIKEFAAHVSHEFKTPLTSMQGAAELLHEHFDEMSEEERQSFIYNIIKDTNRLKRLVTRLLELARADSISLSDEVTIVNEVLHNLKQKYSINNLVIAIEIDIDIENKIHISQDNFEEIIINLIDNSIQHGANKISIIVDIIDDKTQIKFIDDGEGISEANRSKIFTPFFTTKRDTGGTGLGLGIIKSLIETYGGSITLGNSSNTTEFILIFK